MLQARRITPLHVVDDVEAAGVAFAALGFERIDTETTDCTGWRVPNGTGVVLASRALIERAFGEETAERLGGSAVPYVHVESLSDALETLGEGAELIAEACTSYGTREAVVETGSGLMVLAEATTTPS